MPSLRRFLRRLLNVVLPHRDEDALSRELAAHLALLEDEFRRRGLSAAEARRHAWLALGGIEQAKERHRDARSFRWLDDLRRDAFYAIRLMRRSPVAALAAILSLAIGIGLNAAIFTVVDWVLLRPLPFAAPQELVRVFTAGISPATAPAAVTFSELAAFSHTNVFRDAAGVSTTTRVMTGRDLDPTHVVIARVAGDLFSTLGAQPAIGRSFSRQELAAAAPVVVLSHAVWQQRFGADPAVVGRAIGIDGSPAVVIGVMGPGRGYPADADLWRPLTAAEREDDDRDLVVIGRVSDHVPPSRASAEVGTIARAMSNGARTAWVEDLQRTTVTSVSAALQTLLAAAMLTLVLACANVAALVGARAVDRAGEMGLRGALGATRRRVLAQLLTESVVLSTAGGVLGLLLGQWALNGLVALAPVAIPRLAEISLDGRVIGIGALLTIITGVAVGLAPALQLSSETLTSAIGRTSARATARSNGRRILVGAQIAIAVVLTTGAVLLTRSLQHLVAIDHGFSPDRLLSVELSLGRGFSGDARQLFRELIAGAETLPGIEAAAVAMRLPTQIVGVRTAIAVVGEARASATATLRPVSPTYFDTVGLRLTEGRAFNEADLPNRSRVAIVNAAFVRDILGGRSAVGARLTASLFDGTASIVGVVSDTTPGAQADRPALYVPVAQLGIGGGYLIVRAATDPDSIVPSLKARLRSVAPALALDRTRRVAAALEESRAVTRFSTELASGFAGLALLLATIGVYGLTASDVAARWRELAVRLALGASRSTALWTIVRPCAAILAAGAALGVVGALAAGPSLQSLLQGVRATDALALAVAPLFLCAIGLIAAILAARRVLGANPAATLRNG
jgi:putative ABC transport system permease protein